MALSTGTVIGGRFLAPHAAKVSLALAKRVTYRWRVDRGVNDRVEFKYNRRQFRTWLKSVTREDLASPVESAGARLAMRLDVWLAERDNGWAGRADHLSEALRLVEAMYLSILAAVEPGAGRQLAEQWARSRNQELVAALVESAAGTAPLAPEDLAVWLRRRSAERRRIRLAAFNPEEAAVATSMSAIRDLVPNVLPGSYVSLVGPFGAGKSEIAEEWHLAAISNFSTDAGAPFPLWLHARNVASSTLDESLAAHVAGAQLRSRGVTVVVDGLDEVDAAAAAAIVRDARVFVAGDKRSSVLATCRPGTLAASRDDLHVSPLTEEAARQLVESLAESRHATWRWSPGLVETVKRPFFALAAGTLLATGEAPSGQAELTARLVEQALAQAGSSNATSSAETFALLIRLGVSLTASNGSSDGLEFRERQIVRSTRLVTSVSQHLVAFALPIFEQWFAAKALLSDDNLVEQALASPKAFDRWRWALSIAVLSSEVGRLDDLVEACIRMNPGAGAWIVEAVSEPRRLPLDDNAVPLDQDASARRLLRACRAWIDALGPLAPEVLPVDSQGAAVRIGVRVSQKRWISVAWARGVATEDEAIELPDGLSLFERSDDWFAQSAGVVSAGEQWPWTTVRDWVSGEVMRMLEGDSVLGPPNGVWHAERRFRAARVLMGRRGVLFEPLERLRVIERCEQFLEVVDDPRYASFSSGSARIPGAEVAELLDWLTDQVFDTLKRPVPTPDRGLRDSRGWISDLYSPEQMVRFCAETYGLACQAYEEMADTVLSTFGWSLGMNACRPVGVLGVVEYRQQLGGDGASLHFTELPLELLRGAAASRHGLVWSANGRAAVSLGERPALDTDYFDSLREWSSHHVESPFWSLSTGSSVIHVGHERPASEIAAKWIWRDLKRLSLGRGTFPRLER